ncbi:hypothetical protein GCM10025875_08270 [Litorihabitans aurantiacus]|uniref:Cys/Met metabolism PLP-dependent enzyme n=1 Tax=Litorihabitans aurantiacus TaxID=1930061 RepID=A0AA37ULW7_9MICO|nr:hypothetical protein GCM10025875_08270 [Litorihabitans aurantiacus]
MRSTAESTPAAVAHEIACSLLRPPKMIATRVLLTRRDYAAPSRPQRTAALRVGVMTRRPRPATVVVEAGRPERTPGAPVNSPIVMSSTYVGHEHPGPGEKVYARIGTESWEPLEEALGELENAGRPGLLFASGMAAISAALDLTAVGGAVVAPRHAYHESLVALRYLSERSGVEPRLVDIADTDAVLAAIRGENGVDGAAPPYPPPSSGSRPRPTRCSRSPTSPRSRQPRTRWARSSSSTTRSRRRSCSDPSSSAPTSWSTP